MGNAGSLQLKMEDAKIGKLFESPEVPRFQKLPVRREDGKLILNSKLIHRLTVLPAKNPNRNNNLIIFAAP